MEMAKDDPKGGTYIGDLPNDVLIIIFSELSQDAGLIKVAQVHDRFRVLLLPFLHRSLRLEAKHMRGSDYSSLNSEELPPGLVPENLSLILRKYPYLYGTVRKLSLMVHNVSWYENTGGYQSLIQLLRSLQDISLNPPPKEYNFPMTDRLTTMKFDFSYEHGRFWTPRRLIDATPFDLNEYLSKPTLRKLQFEHIENLYYSPVHSGNPGSSAVTDIHFIDWLPQRVDILTSVLPSFRHLERFVLEVDGYWQGESIHRLAPYDYGLLLQPHSASLEELTIAYNDEAYSDGRCPRKPRPVMGTLTNYHNLKKLAIPEPFLAELKDPSFHKLLPPHLEELQIQYPMGTTNRIPDRQGHLLSYPPYRLLRMQKLAKNKESFVPRLRHVIWWFQQTTLQVSMGDPPPFNYLRNLNNGSNATRWWNDPRQGPLYGPPDDMENLAEDFRKVNVKFEWVSIPWLKDTPFGEYSRIK